MNNEACGAGDVHSPGSRSWPWEIVEAGRERVEEGKASRCESRSPLGPAEGQMWQPVQETRGAQHQAGGTVGRSGRGGPQAQVPEPTWLPVLAWTEPGGVGGAPTAGQGGSAARLQRRFTGRAARFSKLRIPVYFEFQINEKELHSIIMFRFHSLFIWKSSLIRCPVLYLETLQGEGFRGPSQALEGCRAPAGPA